MEGMSNFYMLDVDCLFIACDNSLSKKGVFLEEFIINLLKNASEDCDNSTYICLLHGAKTATIYKEKKHIIFH
jgi:hypothetical protein